MHERRRKKLAEGLGYVADGAASGQRMRDNAKRILDELAARLPPEAMAAAYARYGGRPLGEVVRSDLQAL
jgi:hypothetical protein